MRHLFGLLTLLGAGLGCSSEPERSPNAPTASVAAGADAAGSGAKASEGGAQAQAGMQSQGGTPSQGGRSSAAGDTSVPEGGNGAPDGSGGAPTSPACPPSAPYGKTAGSVAADATLFDCDGNAVSLHELCENEVSVVYTFAAWCPVCKAHMEEGLPNNLLAAHEAKGLVEWVVVTENAAGGPASAQLCGLTRDTYGLTPRVLFDAGDLLHTNVGVQVNSGGLVLSSGAVIELNLGYDFDAIEAKVAELLP